MAPLSFNNVNFFYFSSQRKRIQDVSLDVFCLWQFGYFPPRSSPVRQTERNDISSVECAAFNGWRNCPETKKNILNYDPKQRDSTTFQCGDAKNKS